MINRRSFIGIAASTVLAVPAVGAETIIAPINDMESRIYDFDVIGDYEEFYLRGPSMMGSVYIHSNAGIPMDRPTFYSNGTYNDGKLHQIIGTRFRVECDHATAMAAATKVYKNCRVAAVSLPTNTSDAWAWRAEFLTMSPPNNFVNPYDESFYYSHKVTKKFDNHQYYDTRTA